VTPKAEEFPIPLETKQHETKAAETKRNAVPSS